MQFSPPPLLSNAHVQTILPTLFRGSRMFPRSIWRWKYSRERIELPDGDFCDVSWRKGGSSNLLVIAHGLEGSAESHYVRSAAELFHSAGFDIAAWNNRGCSGEPNRLFPSYHSGKTDDLRFLLNRFAEQSPYERIFLLGYSVGGNVILKYLGERDSIPKQVQQAVTISVPLSLGACADELAKKSNAIYMKRFLRLLKQKLVVKQETFPDLVDLSNYESVRNFHDFDGRYTAPMFGYDSAKHYWDENSSMHFLSSIETPTVLISSLDDPFLNEVCFPELSANSHIQTIYTKKGGHVGYLHSPLAPHCWGEQAALSCIQAFQNRTLSS